MKSKEEIENLINNYLIIKETHKGFGLYIKNDGDFEYILATTDSGININLLHECVKNMLINVVNKCVKE